MTRKRIHSCLAVVACLALGGLITTHSQELGTITFATSAAPAAQPAFLEGVKDLHSFQFDEAAVAFQKAQQLDPGFALAYWGEAMSYNHPLWAQLDLEAARKALEKLAPALDGRLAKARTPKEKAFIDAVNQLFYAPGDKLARDTAYSQAMSRMYGQWPEDHEVAIFYALSLLGTVRPGDTGFRRQALAASIAETVFKENPNHPGAAHFIIHAFDDPDHAILALPAARAYAKIAPSATHAVHMPAHIFVQLGMWEDVAKSNTIAYKLATDLNARMHLPEGREDFHTLSWLEYANLMMGKFDAAKQNVEWAKQAADRNATNAGVRAGYLGMRARYILETGQWEKIPVGDMADAKSGEAHAPMPNMPGMAMGGSNDNSGPWAFIAGVSAAKLGDFATAEKGRSAAPRHAGTDRSRRKCLRRQTVRHHGKTSRRGDQARAGSEGRGRAARQRSGHRRVDDGRAVRASGTDQAFAGAVRRHIARRGSNPGGGRRLRAGVAAHAQAHPISEGPRPREIRRGRDAITIVHRSSRHV